MSNNGSFNQTPDPLTFWGDLVVHTFVFWGTEPQDDWQQFTVQEKSFKALLPKNIPCIIIPPATQARDFATIVVYIVMSHCVRCHIWASEITRADLSSV